MRLRLLDRVRRSRWRRASQPGATRSRGSATTPGPAVRPGPGERPAGIRPGPTAGWAAGVRARPAPAAAGSGLSGAGRRPGGRSRGHGRRSPAAPAAARRSRARDTGSTGPRHRLPPGRTPPPPAPGTGSTGPSAAPHRAGRRACPAAAAGHQPGRRRARRRRAAPRASASRVRPHGGGGARRPGPAGGAPPPRGLPWYEIAQSNRTAARPRHCGHIETGPPGVGRRAWSRRPRWRRHRPAGRAAAADQGASSRPGWTRSTSARGAFPTSTTWARLSGVPLPSGRATWDACAGAYGERKIIVGSRPSPTPDVMCHEIGHALDDLDGADEQWQSDSAEFSSSTSGACRTW